MKGEAKRHIGKQDKNISRVGRRGKEKKQRERKRERERCTMPAEGAVYNDLPLFVF